jgi:hypothetical protein
MSPSPRSSLLQSLVYRAILAASGPDEIGPSRREARDLATGLLTGQVDPRQWALDHHKISSECEAEHARWGGVTCVYFIRMDAPRGPRPIKIGLSNRPGGRRLSLLTGSPYPLTLLATFPDCLLPESMLHAAFQRVGLNGEWFRPSRRLLDLIREIQMVPEPTSWVVRGETDIGNEHLFIGQHLDKERRCVRLNRGDDRRCGSMGSVLTSAGWVCLRHVSASAAGAR